MTRAPKAVLAVSALLCFVWTLYPPVYPRDVLVHVERDSSGEVTYYETELATEWWAVERIDRVVLGNPSDRPLILARDDVPRPLGDAQIRWWLFAPVLLVLASLGGLAMIVSRVRDRRLQN